MKKKISEYINKYLLKHSAEEEKINEFSEFIEEFFVNLPEEFAVVNSDFFYEIENFADEIDEEMISLVIENLRQKDGTLSGAKWSIDEVKSVAKQYDVKSKIEVLGKKFDCEKFWLAMNYVYATHYSINRTINGYVDLAIDEYANRNICFDTTIKKIFEKI
jgi:hypothetical protein